MNSSVHTFDKVMHTSRPSYYYSTISTASNDFVTRVSANPESFFLPIMIVGAILSILTIGGNLLIILAYFRNKKIRSISNIPILSLAFTDMFIGFFPLTMNIMEISFGYWPLGKVMCNVALVLDYVSVQSSINHIVLINYDWYLSNISGMNNRLHQKSSRVFIKLLTVWFIAAIIWMPYINIYTLIARRDNPDDNQCYKRFSKVTDYNFKRYAFVTMSLVGYFLPLSFVIITYGKIYFIFKQQLYQMSKFFHAPNIKNNFSALTTKWHMSSQASDRLLDTAADMKKKDSKKRRILGHKKAFRMIASIISAFLITGLPLNAQWLLIGMCPSCYNPVVFDVCNFLTYLNSVINPFLYAYLSRTFRLEFKKLILCGYLCNDFSSSKKLHIDYRANYKELSRSELTEII